MSKSETPRTDAIHSEKDKEFRDNLTQYRFMHDHAETLERELAAARAEIKDLHKAYGFELRDPNGTIWEYAAKMKEEIIAARAELTAATEQRDRLAEALRNCLPFISGEGCGEYQDAKEALQSLTTNEQ
jgi:hypothetical protein